MDELFHLAGGKVVVGVCIFIRYAYPFAGDDRAVQVDDRDGEVIACDIDPGGIARIRDTAQHICFAASGGFKKAGVMDQPVGLQAVQVVGDSGEAKTQICGDVLPGTGAFVVDRPVYVSKVSGFCIFFVHDVHLRFYSSTIVARSAGNN